VKPCAEAGLGVEAAASLPVKIGGRISMEPTAVKPNIHPEYHEINIIMTDGTEFKTMSCMGKAGDTLRLDIDPKSHPAWTGVQRMVDTGGQVAKFNKKFASIGKRTK
jgi:large subunit ribosomal protein L31